MSYPGNATLTQEMQERILSTFQQTLTAAAAGNRQEATLGCDFILRLDSLFAPARDLLARLEDGEGPVETEDLAAAVTGDTAEPPSESPAETSPPAAGDAATEAAPEAPQPPAIDDLSDLDLEANAGAPVPAAPATEAQTVSETPTPAAPAAPEAPTSEAAPVPEAPTLETQVAPEVVAPAVEAPPVEPPPPTPQPAAGGVDAVSPPAAATPPAEPAPAVDDLEDLDLGLGDGAPAPPAEPPPAQAVEPAAQPDVPTPPVAADTQPEAASAPAEPPAPSLGELEDLDLSAQGDGGAEATAETPPAEAPVEEPAAASAALESAEIPLHSEPAAQLDTESQQRIDDLLTEGQEAFDSGEYQGAIDAWSRIFLIDIDHAEANKRIEEARRLKAEADRKVEEKFHEGLAHLEGGETDAAAESFRAVLEMTSSHLAARNYLEKLEAGEVPVPTELSRPAEVEGAEEDLAASDFESLDGDGDQPKAKPDRGSKAVGERVVTVKKSPFKSKTFLTIAGLGVVAVLAGGWYLWQNWETYFPNSAPEEPVQVAADPLARARGLHEQGKTAIAIAQLRRLPPDSPQYDEAQALIAQWELQQAPTEVGPNGPSPQEMARRQALVADAGAAADRREYMRTSQLLSEAATIAPLSGSEVQLLARADEQLQELQNFITLFREGEWDMALRDLWLLHEADPGNRDVTRLLVDSYYNLGLRSLQRQDVKMAAEQFNEALGLSPDDPELLRLADFAATYQTRSSDLLYRIYVKYHPFR